MEKSILQKTIQKCRNAMFAGIPIVYIKTDSNVFIDRLVKTQEDPLVVLVDKDAMGSNQIRPFESMDERSQILDKCKNFIQNKLPNKADLNAAASANALIDSSMPIICTYKMPNNLSHPAALEDVFNNLEEYVLAHENPSDELYAVLQSSIVILYSSVVHLSPMLRTYTEIIELDYPEDDEIRSIIKSVFGGELSECIGGAENLSELCTDLTGFTAEEVEMAAQTILALSGVDESAQNPEDRLRLSKNIIYNRKKQKLEGGVLEHMKTDETGIGGFEKYKNWLKKQQTPLNKSVDYRKLLGVNPPNGVLLCGIPGCGKSEAAKFTAQTLKLPLLKMDIGSLMGSLVGESEGKMREALKMAQAMSPCVLLIDEIEKGFSGARSSGGDGDGGTFKRMFGYLLGWMQENTYPIFIIATANDITGLPKEFFRSGRFDALYGVFLPTAEECAKIFLESMKKAVKVITKKTKQNDANLFDEDCKDEKLYLKIIDNCLVKGGKARIIIGSDIKKAVDISLRSLASQVFDGNRIKKEQWERALKRTLNDPSFSTYGQGEENLDGIVINYCRMLRKGFISTADNSMFTADDYHAEVITEILQKKKEMATADPERVQQLKQQISEKKVLTPVDLDKRGLKSEYDKAVYACLYDKMNQVAFDLEQFEKEQMIRS